MGGTGGTEDKGFTAGTGGNVDTGGGPGMGGIGGKVGIVGNGGIGGGTVLKEDIAVVMVDPMLRFGLLKLLKFGGMLPMVVEAKVGALLLLTGSLTETAVVAVVEVVLLKPCAVVGKLTLSVPPILGGPDLLLFPEAPSALPVSKRLRLNSIMFCISVLLLSNSDTLEPLIVPPVRIIPSLASSSVANTIKASPWSPPTICTPPSGIVRPEKKWRMSMVPATIGRPCKRMTTAMLRCYNAHL